MERFFRVVFIRHSAFFVETEHAQLLFDYYRGDLPMIDPEKPLLIFASHSHDDHFSKIIFALTGKAKETFYVLSDDIQSSFVPEELRAQTILTGPDAEIRIPDSGMWPASHKRAAIRPSAIAPAEPPEEHAPPRAKTPERAVAPEKDQHETHALARVKTLPSNDAGVAFLIETDGFRFYHAGDLNNWWWDGDREDQKMAAFYHAQLEKIRGMHFDAAFIPLDPRITGWWRGAEDFLQYADADKIFPMHYGEDPAIVREMETRWTDSPHLSKLAKIRKTGQAFTLKSPNAW